MPKRDPFDEHTVRRFVELHERGASQLQLAVEFDCSTTFIRLMLKKHGCNPHKQGRRTTRLDLDTDAMKKMREEGLSYREISRRLRCDPSGVRRRVLGL